MVRPERLELPTPCFVGVGEQFVTTCDDALPPNIHAGRSALRAYVGLLPIATTFEGSVHQNVHQIFEPAIREPWPFTCRIRPTHPEPIVRHWRPFYGLTAPAEPGRANTAVGWGQAAANPGPPLAVADAHQHGKAFLFYSYRDGRTEILEQAID